MFQINVTYLVRKINFNNRLKINVYSTIIYVIEYKHRVSIIYIYTYILQYINLLEFTKFLLHLQLHYIRHINRYTTNIPKTSSTPLYLNVLLMMCLWFTAALFVKHLMGFWLSCFFTCNFCSGVSYWERNIVK